MESEGASLLASHFALAFACGESILMMGTGQCIILPLTHKNRLSDSHQSPGGPLITSLFRCQILEHSCHYVKPKNKDVNDNILAEMSRDCFGITEDKIKHALSLDSVLSQVGHLEARFL